MPVMPSLPDALVSLIGGKGQGQPYAWQAIRASRPLLAGYLAGLGDDGWPALAREVNDRRKASVLALEALIREAHAEDDAAAREAWEFLIASGGEDNGGQAGYLWDVAPTVAGRIRDAMDAAEAGEAAAWFPWTKKAARAAAWAWTDGYLVRAQQEKDGLPAFRQDFREDLEARVSREHPKEAFAATLRGAASGWAIEWLTKNKPTKGENTMPWQNETQPKTALAILAGIQKYEAARVAPVAMADALPPIEEEEFSDLFEEA